MKKLTFLLALCVTAPAVATTICADDDVIAIVLDPRVVGITSTSKANLFEWSVTFSYGTIWGSATCMDRNGTENVAVNELRSEDGTLARGGEIKGQYCWCQMTHPVPSRWVFNSALSSKEECESTCAGHCGSRIHNYYAGRQGIFGATAN